MVLVLQVVLVFVDFVPIAKLQLMFSPNKSGKQVWLRQHVGFMLPIWG